MVVSGHTRGRMRRRSPALLVAAMVMAFLVVLAFRPRAGDPETRLPQRYKLADLIEENAEEARARLHQALTDSARRWTGTTQVRFVADASIIHRWSEAKE